MIWEWNVYYILYLKIEPHDYLLGHMPHEHSRSQLETLRKINIHVLDAMIEHQVWPWRQTSQPESNYGCSFPPLALYYAGWSLKAAVIRVHWTNGHWSKFSLNCSHLLLCLSYQERTWAAFKEITGRWRTLYTLTFFFEERKEIYKDATFSFSDLYQVTIGLF